MARKSTPLLQTEKIEESGIYVFWRYHHQNLCPTLRRAIKEQIKLDNAQSKLLLKTIFCNNLWEKY